MTDINLRTVNGKLKALWESEPDKDAMIFYDDDNERHVWTNSDVEHLTLKLASYLFVHGVKRGDVVCNMMSNSVEREIVNFGILMAGAIVMHGDQISDRGQQFWEPLTRAKAKFIVVSPDPFSPGWKMLKDDCGLSDADVEILSRSKDDAPGVKKVFKFHLDYRIKNQKEKQRLTGKGSIRSCFDIINAHEGSMYEKVSNHTPACILVDKDASEKHYTMVRRTHGDVIHIGQRLQEMLGCTAKDIIYTDKPLSWIPGLAYHYITMGCTNVRSSLTDCPMRKIVPDTWWLLSEENVTMGALSAPMIQMLSSHCEDLEEPHHRLRMISTGGNDVRQSLMDAIGPCCDTMIICYSRIETGLIARLLVTEESKSMYITGCVGELAMPGSGCVEPKRGSKSSPVGEILLNGQLMSREYVNDKELTDISYTEDGYLLTGDIGFFNEEKKLFVLGRKTDAIIRGSIPIFPREIEAKVNQCPGIWKVKVVPIKDDRSNTQMCACVIPRSDDTLTMEGVKEFCRYQLGGTHNDDDNPHMPTYIFFFDSFPTIGGKTNRRMLTYMAQEILNGKIGGI